MNVEIEKLGLRLDNDYVDEALRTILENHLPRLKKLAENNIIEVTPAEAYKYDYNYYGLLRYKNVDYRIHWLTLRVNDRVNPDASCIEVRQIKVPPIEEVTRLLNYHKSTRNKGML